MSRKILSIDIRSDAVSALLLQSKIKGVSIEAHAYRPLPEPNEIKNGISDCIGLLKKQADLSGAPCIAACLLKKIYRNIRVPFKKKQSQQICLMSWIPPAAAGGRTDHRFLPSRPRRSKQPYRHIGRGG